MTMMQFAIAAAVLLLPITGTVVCCLAMLERIEKHLRQQHVAALGPVLERTPEDMEIRRKELGLDDGYPYKQIRSVALAFGTTLLILYLSTLW
jgi:hypothetical protein